MSLPAVDVQSSSALEVDPAIGALQGLLRRLETARTPAKGERAQP
jgi:hypothetical protein